MRRRMLCSLLLFLAVAPLACTLSEQPAWSTTPTFTWSGTDALNVSVLNSDMSDPNNWVGGIAPTSADGTVDLVLPSIVAPTEFLTDDIPSLTVGTISSPGNYLVIGPQTLTIDTSVTGGVGFDLPVVLGGTTQQTWTFDAPSAFTEISQDSLSGSAPLQIVLGNGVTGTISGTVEVGNLSVDGANTAETGGNAGLNGKLEVENANVNWVDGNPIAVSDVALVLAGASTSPLTTLGSSLTSGQYPSFGGGSVIDGSVSLSAGTPLQYNAFVPSDPGIFSAPATPSITAAGSIALGNAPLTVDVSCGANAGATFTLLHAGTGFTGNLLDGTGQPITDGEVLQTTLTNSAECGGEAPSQAPLAQVHITETEITLTSLPFPTTMQISTVGPTDTNDPLSLEAVVAAAAYGQPSGTVAFAIDGVPVDGCTNVALGYETGSSSVASCNAGYYTGGSLTVTASYAGDTYYSGSTSSRQAVISPPDASGGYWETGADGSVYNYGNAPYLGDVGGQPLNEPIVGMAPTWDDDGYWEVATDGGIFAFGDATFYGSTGSMHLNKPIVGMAGTADSGGYWLLASDGGIFAYGDAQFYGSTGGIHLNKPIVGMTPTGDGGGYWLVASDGGIFAYGDAQFYGSTGSIHLNRPIVAMAASPDGGGYWLVASDGGIFAYGDAQFYGSTGSIHLNKPIVDMAPTADGGGYWLVASDGGIFAYGDAQFFGSTGGTPIPAPIVTLRGT